MQTIKSLRHLLNIKAGTLIRGVYVSDDGEVFISTEKWYFEQKKYVKGVWSTIDREKITFNFIKNTYIERLLCDKQLIMLGDSMDIGTSDYMTYRKNGISLFGEITTWRNQEIVKMNNILGISLEKNIIAIRPFQIATYRPDIYTVYVFHKILHMDSIKWVMFYINPVNKNTLIQNNFDDLLDFSMKMV